MMPISVSRRNDRFYWKYDELGVSNMKSGYTESIKMAKPAKFNQQNGGECSKTNQDMNCWTFLWKLNVKHDQTLRMEMSQQCTPSQ